ncbi:MAG: FkbM family methyltransferase [Thermodesulfobacteriota bacterium]|nr:FkbM family methyltransferase [Thermodesulfobacteriota bacterium]
MPNEDVVLGFDDQLIIVHNPRRNVIGQEIFLKGVWEPEVTRYIASRIRPGMTILDVGADIGYYTLLFAKRVGPQGMVFAFEPIPEACVTLEKNIRLNGYQNVRVLDYALYDSNGFFVLEGPLDISRINPLKAGEGENDLRVETRVFDDCLEELDVDCIDLVKIDVEGAEMNVLEGMKKSLQKFHPALLVEVHPNYLGSFNRASEDLMEFLDDMGYRITPVDRPALNFQKGNITIHCRY